jgi:hypothetical protein
LTVNALVETVQDVQNNPPKTEEARAKVRAIFSQGLESEHVDATRFSALYIIKSALDVPPNGINTPLAVRARQVVELLSKKKDPEAMVLHASLLEQSTKIHHFGEAMLDADTLLEEALLILNNGAWTRGPAAHQIVSQGDALHAYGSFKVQYEPENRQKGIDALTRAVNEFGHFAACKELESRLEPRSEAHYRCLLSLAVTGHAEAAKKIGDLMCCTQDEFAELSKEMQRDFRSSDWLIQFLSNRFGRRAQRQMGQIADFDDTDPFINFLHMSLTKGQINAEASRPPPYTSWRWWTRLKVKAWFIKHMPKGLGNSESKTDEWIQGAESDIETINTNISWWYRSDAVTSADSPFRYDFRSYSNHQQIVKAIDWYKFASILGHVPAMFEGLYNSLNLGAPWEAAWFYEQLRSVPPDEMVKYPDIYTKMKHIDTVYQSAITAVTGVKPGMEPMYDLKRVKIYGGV